MIFKTGYHKVQKKKPFKKGSQFSESDNLKLIHQLEVHQEELELQKEKLIKARTAAQDAADK